MTAAKDPKVSVPVKSPWTSKVNWAAGLTAITTVLTQIGPQIAPLIPAPWGTVVVAVIGGLVTIYMRTFPAPSALSPSVGK